MLRAKNIQKLEINESDPWTEILSSVAYAVRSTYHTTLGATPAQLVFGRDMVYPLAYVAEWDVIRRNKQRLIDKNNARENAACVDHDYRVGDKVLIINSDIQRKLDSPTKGPFPVTEIFTNGNVVIQRGKVFDRLNIRHLKPFYEKVTAD